MRRVTISSSGERLYRASHDEAGEAATMMGANNNDEDQRAEAPLEPAMMAMCVVVEGSMMSFACYDEDRNEILLETCRSSGQETKEIVERLLTVVRPNLVLVGPKILNNEDLLEALTTPPVDVVVGDPTHGGADGNSEANQSQSIPYRLLKTTAFEIRQCRSLVLQNLRVESLSQHENRESGERHFNPSSQERQFPLSGDQRTFRPSSYHSLAAVVDFDSKIQVRTIGALLSFLQSTIFRLEENAMVSVNRISLVKSNRYMHIDAGTFSALHIFNTEHHPLIAKGAGSSKEGFSLYSLLDRTQSKGGSQLLKEWMMRPLLDVNEISQRHDTVELFMQPALQTSVGVLLNTLANVGPMDKVLLRLQKCTSKPNDIPALMKSLSATVNIATVLHKDVLPLLERQTAHEFTRSFLSQIFERCNAAVLATLHDRIAAVVDIEATLQMKTTLVIREGFHPELDHLKEVFASLEETLEAVGTTIQQTHPEFDGLSVVYVPQIGFLVALEKMSIMTRAVAVPEDFIHVFNQDSEAFFKTEITRSLDEEIGDIDLHIKEIESRITTELEELILDAEVVIREAFLALSELDCILAFSDCAVDLRFKRPIVTDANGNQVVVKEGRHPLQEFISEREFVPNDVSLDDTNRIIVVTGPNFSGKSCYLRQVGLLVYMTQIGSFIPCREAEIAVVDQLCSRISSVESCTVPQSSFQLDLTQMASILQRCTSKSLVLIDEFGKGTSPASGIGILGAALTKLSQIKCKVVCTTHFLELFSMDVIRDNENGIKARRMAIHLPDGIEDDAAPLFKLEEGVAKSSAGLICAKRAGVREDIIKRARHIMDSIKEGKTLKPWAEALGQRAMLATDAELDVVDYFLSVENWKAATEDELRAILQKIANVQ